MVHSASVAGGGRQLYEQMFFAVDWRVPFGAPSIDRNFNLPMCRLGYRLSLYHGQEPPGYPLGPSPSPC